MRKIKAIAAAITVAGTLMASAMPTAASAASSLVPTPIGTPVTTTTVTHSTVNGTAVEITTTSTAYRLRKPGIQPNTAACGSFPKGVIGYTQGQQTYKWAGGVVTETQRFQAFYDGCYAWYAPRYGWDTSNYHMCDLGSTNFGYSKTVLSCYTTPSSGTISSEIGFGDQFKICTVGNLAGCSTFRMGDFVTKGGDIHG